MFSVPLIETVFPPLYLPAFFVKDKVPIGVWVYLWVFYLVPSENISVFVQVSYCLDDCSFIVQVKVRKIWFLQFHFSSSRLLWLFGIFCVFEIMKFLFLVLWKMPLVVWWGLHWICRLLWVLQSFSQYWFAQSRNMLYLPICLCHLSFISSVSPDCSWWKFMLFSLIPPTEVLSELL